MSIKRQMHYRVGSEFKILYWANDLITQYQWQRMTPIRSFLHHGLSSLSFSSQNEKTFWPAMPPRCFIKRLMQRLLYLQLWDHLPPLYRVLLLPFTPKLHHSPSNEWGASNACVDHTVPRPSVGYGLFSSWSLYERNEAQLKCHVDAHKWLH